MEPLNNLKIKIFFDSADLAEIRSASKLGIVKGFTTNPALMKKAGVSDYEQFAREVIKVVPDLPVSFEVFSDDFPEMEREALKIAGWAKNINVKIPVTNTKGESSVGLIKKLSAKGLFLNITAIMTVGQVEEIAAVLNPQAKTIISVFAGRIADTGRDPVPYMKKIALILKSNPGAELLWASSREVMNIFQAQESGCHIITVTPELVKKIPLIGKDLGAFSLDTVKLFHNDALSSGYKL